MKRLVVGLTLLFVALALTACQSTSTTGTPQSGEKGAVEDIALKDGSTLHFPRQPKSGGDQMEALLDGELMLDNGCLRAVTGDSAAPGFLILWPSTAVPRIAEDGSLEVLDGSGKVIGRVGEPIRLAGGAMEDESSMAFWEEQIDGLPIETCPGPYWVAGASYPLAGLDGTPTQPLATPYAQEPAAGICAEFDGSTVSVSLRPDVPDPRCVRVRPDQILSIKNDTDQNLQVSIAGFHAELAPGQEITFETPFGEYLEPGVHQLTTSAPPGGPEIWLLEDQTTTKTIPVRQPPIVVQDEPGPLYDTLFSIPIGEGGIRYRGAGVPEMQVTGPIGLVVLPDGNFVIGDVYDNRLLWYSPSGKQLKVLDLYSLDILNVSDLVTTSNKLCLLEISFSVAPERYRVDCLSLDGKLLSQYNIPIGYHFEDGLYGLAVGGEGEILLEFYGEAYRLFQVPGNSANNPEQIAGIPAFGHIYQIQFANQEGDLSSITYEDHKFVSEMRLGGIMKLLAVNPDGSFYIIREEMVDDYPIIVGDQTIHFINADGEQLGVARYLLSEWYSFVQRNLAVGPDGNVYALITRPESVDILRLAFFQKVGPLIASGVEPRVIDQALTDMRTPVPETATDCTGIEHLAPDSQEAQQIVQEFMANFTRKYPTEYMGFEQLWSVDRLEDWAIIQGMVTVEEIDAIAVRRGLQGFEVVGRYTATMPGPTHSNIPQYFIEQLPDAPSELFQCLDLSRFTE